MTYGSRLNRLVAAIIDGVILGLISWTVSFLLINMTQGLSSNTIGVTSYVFNLTISILYFVVYQAKSGQTLGKKLMGIRVVNASGQRPDMQTFFIREVIGKFASSIILGIGYLMILWDKKRQGLHDKIADTYVVKV